MSIETDVNTHVTIEIEDDTIWLMSEHCIIAFDEIKELREVTRREVKFANFSIPRKWLSDEQFEVLRKLI